MRESHEKLPIWYFVAVVEGRERYKVGPLHHVEPGCTQTHVLNSYDYPFSLLWNFVAADGRH